MSPNAAVLVGSTAAFTCHTNSTRVCWTYQENIYDIEFVDVKTKKGYDEKYVNRCSITTQNTEGTYSTLTINNVQLSDAGFYSCGDCFDLKATTHLLVLGKKFKYVKLQCFNQEFMS